MKLSAAPFAYLSYSASGIEVSNFQVLRRSQLSPSFRTTAMVALPLEEDLRLDSSDWLQSQFSLSMSMSMATDVPTDTSPGRPTAAPLATSSPMGTTSSAPVPDTSPTSAPVTPEPTVFPTATAHPTQTRTPSVSPTTSQPTVTGLPSFSPTLTPLPSSPITQVPTITEGPNSFPTTETTSPQPSPSVVGQQAIFACSDEGVTEAPPPITTTTMVQIEVGFDLETLSDLEEIRSDLEREIFAQSVIGALDCSAEGPIFGENGTLPEFSVTTLATNETCLADFSICTSYLSIFEFAINVETEPDFAAFLSYVRLQETMDSGRLVETIPRLDRAEYTSPLPLLTPLPAEPETQPVLRSDQGTTSIAATAVAVVALVTGAAAIGRWQWNRRVRNNAHMALHEDESDNIP